MKEPTNNNVCSPRYRRKHVTRKRRRGEIGAHDLRSQLLVVSSAPVSISAATSTLLSYLLIASSALTHVPVPMSPHATRTQPHAFGKIKTPTRAAQTQLDVTSSRSSISLDEIDLPNSLERTGIRTNNWNVRYFDLVKYKRAHGHTNVPLSYPDTQLAIWVRNQRHQFRHLLNRRRSTLTRDRYEKLCAIDFDFGTPFRETWGIRYGQLGAFKERRGHCNVPSLWDENPALSRWVAMQRVYYRNLHSGMKPDISPDRVKALEDIGFEWNVHENKWQGMLERTRRTLFFVEDGEARDDEKEGTLERRPDWTKILSQLHNREVRVWIDVQRYQYARFKRGEASSLTSGRIEQIELSIPGFQWIGSRGPRQKEEDSLEEDWSKLVEEAKDVDIEAVAATEKRNEDDFMDWDKTDLMDLWAMEDD